MEYRNLGSSGLKVSTIGLGTNQFGGKVDQAKVTAIMNAAQESGINFIDTADVYQDGKSEETIGKAIQDKRDSFVLATKVFYKTGNDPNDRSSSRKHIMTGVEQSLKRLNTDYIDLYQLHSWDADTHLEETLRALDDLVTSGKVRYIGSSKFSAWQIAHSAGVAELRGWDKFISEQGHYHMFARDCEKEILPACEYLGLGFIPFFPLAGGFLTGKYKQGIAAPKGSRGESSAYVQRYMTDENYAKVEQFTAFAEAEGHTMGELAIAWLLTRPQVSSVISGVTSVAHVQANAKAADWALSAEDIVQINQILDNE